MIQSPGHAACRVPLRPGAADWTAADFQDSHLFLSQYRCYYLSLVTGQLKSCSAYGVLYSRVSRTVWRSQSTAADRALDRQQVASHVNRSRTLFKQFAPEWAVASNSFECILTQCCLRHLQGQDKKQWAAQPSCTAERHTCRRKCFLLPASAFTSKLGCSNVFRFGLYKAGGGNKVCTGQSSCWSLEVPSDRLCYIAGRRLQLDSMSNRVQSKQADI